jgi:hypothetical protein
MPEGEDTDCQDFQDAEKKDHRWQKDLDTDCQDFQDAEKRITDDTDGHRWTQMNTDEEIE